MNFKCPPDPNIKFSVIIGRASRIDPNRILETLEALRKQVGDHEYEVVLSDRCNDDITRRIRENYPEVRVFSCSIDTCLPAMRTMALAETLGDIILVTEDHCVPADNWLKSIGRVFDTNPDAAIVGGCVINGLDTNILDRATFLCEYANFLPPVREGRAAIVPGMNVAYKRSVFKSIQLDVLTLGFWESTLHPVLHRLGYVMLSTNEARVYHRKSFSFVDFCVQRFLYSRYYAGLRLSLYGNRKNYFAALKSLLVPPVLVYRLIRTVGSGRIRISTFIGAFPALCAFYIVWGAGEFVGYLTDSSDVLCKLE